jgi:DNA-binding IscR family transcriptional regulator
MSKIQSWLSEHGYEINISDFARINKVSEARVEQVLNKMVREGYVTLRG